MLVQELVIVLLVSGNYDLCAERAEPKGASRRKNVRVMTQK
jgi:hypothetical protein